MLSSEEPGDQSLSVVIRSPGVGQPLLLANAVDWRGEQTLLPTLP